MRYKAVIWLALSLLLAAGAAFAADEKTEQADILRLHVIAHSDAPEDQATKLRVRDAILAYEADRADALSAQAARQAVLADGPGLLAVVEQSLRESGVGYGARLALGRYDFPARDYGGALYPAGEYAALRVVLGEGAGQNWWCVLFPPLCILELPDGEIEDEEMQSLILKLWKEGKNKDDSDG